MRRHPESGRSALYLNPMRCDEVEGMDHDEGDALLDRLYARCDQPRFRYSHRWRPGDVLIWDNRSALHRATFDFYSLFEGEHALATVLGELGRTWRVTEVAHKPWPSGRATHAVIDACLGFRGRLGLDRTGGDAVEQITARVPPLVHRLVARRVTDDMDVNYARLCCRYVVAVALLRGRVGLDDFRPAALRDSAIVELAHRVDVVVDGNPDPNALVPVTVEITLRDGRREAECIDVMHGHPARSMTRTAQLEKFHGNCERAARPIAPEAVERIIAAVARLESLPDVTVLVDDLAPEPTTDPSPA